jgi:hypothetical protein
MNARPTFRSHFLPGVQAIRNNWKPIVFIQFCFLVFVVLYYRLPSLSGLPQSVDALRGRWGYVFTIGSIWIASVCVPELAKLVTRQVSTLKLRDILFLMFYYAIVGIALDIFYRSLGSIFGQGTDWLTVLKKMLADQLVFSCLISMPLAALTFMFKESNYQFGRFKEMFAEGEFMKRYLSLLATCWMYFGPLTVAIYSVPQALSYPISMAAQAAWGIIIVAVGSRKN